MPSVAPETADARRSPHAVLHHVLASHLLARNAAAVHAALSLPSVGESTAFWEECDYRCGLAGAVISAHVEDARVSVGAGGEGVPQLSQLQLSQCPSPGNESEDDESGGTQGGNGDPTRGALHRLSLNEVYLLLRACTAEAEAVAGDAPGEAVAAAARRVSEFVTLIERTESAPRASATLDLAEVARTLFCVFECRARRSATVGAKRPREEGDDAAFQEEEERGAEATAKAVLGPDGSVNGAAVADAVSELAAATARESERAAAGEVGTVGEERGASEGAPARGSGTALEALRSVALPGSIRSAASFDDVDVPADAAGGVGHQQYFQLEQQQRRKRHAFTSEEDAAIIAGVRRFTGTSRFTMIFNAYKDVWQEGRTAVHLQDHWRQSLRAAIFERATSQ